MPSKRVPYNVWVGMSDSAKAKLRASVKSKRAARSTKPKQLRKRIENDLSWSIPLFGTSPKQARMMYYDPDQSVTSTSGVPNSRFYQANSLYDPDTTGTGHQPLGFDQMMLMYNQFVVTNARIRVNIQNTVSANVRAVLWVNADTTQITDKSRMIENGLLTTAVLTGFSGSQYSAQSNKSLEYNLDVVKYFGRRGTREILNDVDLQGNASSNPSEGVYFGIGCFEPFGSGTVTIYYDVIIEFTAIFFEPKKLTTS